MGWTINKLKHEVYRRIQEIVYSSYLYSEGSEPVLEARRKVKKLYLTWKEEMSVDEFPEEEAD